MSDNHNIAARLDDTGILERLQAAVAERPAADASLLDEASTCLERALHLPRGDIRLRCDVDGSTCCYRFTIIVSERRKGCPLRRHPRPLKSGPLDHRYPARASERAR
jgi:hypothetical protein